MTVLGINYSTKSDNYNKADSLFLRPNIGLALILFAVISGIRYDVGVDFLSYLELYNWLKYDITTEFGLEVGFNWILKQFAQIDAHYAWPFGTIALIQIFFIYYAFKNEKYLYPFLPFVIITSGVYFTMMNEMRQSISWAIFILAIQYNRKDKIIQYALLTLIAYIFHQSALIFILLFPLILIDKDIFRSYWLQISLITTAMVLSNLNVWNLVLDKIELAITFLGYTDKYDNISSKMSIWEKDYSKGLRYYAPAIIGIITVIYSKTLKSYFNKSVFIKYYNLYFIGILLFFFFYNNTLMQRPARYLTITSIVISSYLFYYLWKFRRKNILNMLSLSILILLHIGILYAFIASNHHTQYLFYWEK